MKCMYYFTVIYMTDDLRKTVYIKTNERNTSFTHCNNHDKVCFLFNNTDSHISRLTANFKHLKDKRNIIIIIINYTIQLYLYFLKFMCSLLYFNR